MGKYCTAQAVIVRLQGKIRFAEPGVRDEDDPNEMSLQLLNTLISEAESQLEIDLMDRYELPFQGINGEPFSALPDNTRITLRNLAELLSVIRVLETDFGRGTSANADKYTEQAQKRYDLIIGKLMAIQEQTKKTSRQWQRRPLDGLMAAYNNQGDTGFRGRVLNTTTLRHEADYAYKQINSPGENIFNGILDSLDHPGDRCAGW